MILENGADPNQTENEHNLTAIHFLVDGPYKGQTINEKERAQLIREMIKKRVAINDRPECLDALIEANVDPNTVFMGERAISIAARQNRDRIFKKLIDYKQTQTDVKSETGGTVLHFAGAGMIDSSEYVDLLIKACLNVNAQDQRGNTPTMVACFFNKPNILKSLIAAKADLTLKNNEGKYVNSICEEKDVDECKAVLQAK